MKLLKLFSIIILVSACAKDLPILEQEANKYNLTTEKQLKDLHYTQKIEDFYSSGQQGYFTGKANIKIYYKIFQQLQKGSPAILISTGRTEAAVKYKELIYDLYNNGYSVYIHDHRGQGLSDRLLENKDMGYIDAFQFYVDDMKYFYNNIVKRTHHKNTYLLAHSMGGTIGITYLEQNPNDFKAAAFSSPMLGFGIGVCTAVNILTGEEPKYALGEIPYDTVPFENNRYTGSKIRFEKMNLAFEKAPKARLGGATYQWVLKSCEQFKSINKHIDQIQTPFILFSAEEEQIVNPKAHKRFIHKISELEKVYEAYEVEGAQHELYIETDKIRIPTINQILRFFNDYK